MDRSAACALLLCLAVALLANVGVEARSVSEHKGDIQEKCIVGKKEYNIHEKWSVLGECNVYTCHGGGSISALTCPSMATDDPKCTFTEVDNKKLYPKCCPQLICTP